MIYAAVIAAAAALIGAAIAAGNDAAARSVREKIAARFGDVALPHLDAVVAQKLPAGAAARYEEVTKSTTAQGDALSAYGDEVHARGETPEDRAAYLRAQNMAGGVENSGRSAVLRALSARGLENSGLSSALQMDNAQAATNRATNAGVEAAGHSRARYLQALQGYGSLAVQMRGQELSALKSQDDINMFNSRQQSEADRYNANLAQRNFDNKMAKMSAQANAENGVANDYDRAADASRQTAGGIGNAAITMGATYDQYGNPRKKQGYDASAGAWDDSGMPLKDWPE